MSTYTPDCWVLLKFTSKDTNESSTKVFGGWYGGFADGDSWKMSSGVESVIDRGDFVEFKNFSGSIYSCYKQQQKMSNYMSSLFSNWEKQLIAEGSTIMTVEPCE